MRHYLGNRLFRIGAILFLVGSGPLLLIMLVARLGLTSDPNPNPIGPGLLAGITFWPSVVLLTIGVLQVRRERHRQE